MTAVGDNNWLFRLVISVNRVALDGVQHRESINAFAKDDVSAVQMRGVDEAEEELRAVGAWASVCHGKNASARVQVGEVLVGELATVDGCATGTVAGREVATLGHELGDHSVEGAVLEVQGLSLGGVSLLTSAESAEVLGGNRCVVVEVDCNTAGSSTTNGDIEEDLGVDSWSCHFNVNAVFSFEVFDYKIPQLFHTLACHPNLN